MVAALATDAGPIRFTDYRCARCGRLVFRAYLLSGACVQVRCKNCRTIVTVKVD